MCYSAKVEKGKVTAERFQAQLDLKAFEQFKHDRRLLRAMSKSDVKAVLGLSRAPRTEVFQWSPAIPDCRVYPGYFAPVIIHAEGSRVVTPMRYRVRPNGSSSEIPSKYNVFNCRLDALQTRQTWKRLFGRQHALFPFVRFYEWVEREGRKQQVAFSPQEHEIMWAPALYDSWQSADGRLFFYSFAIVTDEPPPEVSAAGHDRCPIFLHKDAIDDWLQPQRFKTSELYDLLNHRENERFLCESVD